MNLLDLIHIPDPCHEDWNKMTPQDKGRHCAKCDKVVVDFTSMSSEEADGELRRRFSAGEKVCGHFSSDMLTNGRILAFFYQIRSGKGWIRRFALSLFLVFGGFLFGGWNASAQGQVKLRGKVAAPMPLGEPAIVQEEPEEPVKCVEKGDVVAEEEYLIDGLVDIELEGEVAIWEDTLPQEDTLVQEDVLPLVGDTIVMDRVLEVNGGLAFIPEDEPTEDVPSSDTLDVVGQEPDPDTEQPVEDEQQDETIETPIIAIEPEALGMKIYPNPASDRAVVSIRVVTEGSYQALVYNLEGRVVARLFEDRRLEPGEVKVDVDTADWAPGAYVVSVKGANDSVSSKLVVR